MSQSDNALLNTALKVVIFAILPILASLVGDYLRLQRQRVRAQMSKEQLDFADQLTRRWVKACEQYNLSQQLQQTAEEKKEWVVNVVTQELEKRGISIDVATLMDLVETAVLDEITRPEQGLAAMGGVIDGPRLN